jgi:pilin/secretion family protein with methylation motif
LKTKRKKEAGFSLLELLVVMARNQAEATNRAKSDFLVIPLISMEMK